MKRFWAAVFDYFLCCIFCAVIFYLTWKILRTKIVWRHYFKGIYHLITYFVYFIYSVLFDSLCQGNTPGKDFVGYKFPVCEDEITVGWIVKHALCKTIAMKISIPSAVYYISAAQMPYDRMLGIGCRAKKSDAVEQKEIEDIKTRKRLISILIDHFVMSLLSVMLGSMEVLTIRHFFRDDYIKIVIVLGFFSMLIFMFLFFLILDFATKGSGIGKKITGIRLISDGKEFDSAVIWKHCGMKFAACWIWPVSLFYFLKTGRMFYDEWLKLEVMLEQ